MRKRTGMKKGKTEDEQINIGDGESPVMSKSERTNQAQAGKYCYQAF